MRWQNQASTQNKGVTGQKDKGVKKDKGKQDKGKQDKGVRTKGSGLQVDK